LNALYSLLHCQTYPDALAEEAEILMFLLIDFRQG
jgi:hypothetical protein